jgi:hypothetical protein
MATGWKLQQLISQRVVKSVPGAGHCLLKRCELIRCGFQAGSTPNQMHFSQGSFWHLLHNQPEQGSLEAKLLSYRTPTLHYITAGKVAAEIKHPSRYIYASEALEQRD